MDKLFGELAEEASDLSSVPTGEESVRLRNLALKFVQVSSEVDKLETELSEKKTEKRTMAMTELPDLMNEIGQDVIGLPDANCDLLLSAYYHANISKDWPEEEQVASFDYLEEIGAGDLVKTMVVMQFGRSELDRARAVIALIHQAATFMQNAGVGPGEIPEPIITMSVPWNTLTSFLREQIEKGEILDLEKLGATVGSIVKIKKRKK